MKHKNSILLLCLIAVGSLISGCKKTETAPLEVPCEEKTWYRDADGDGLGNPEVSKKDCGRPDGYVENSEDKVDLKASRAGVPMIFKVTGETCYYCGDWGWEAFASLIDRYKGGKALTWGNYGTGFSNSFFRNQEITETMQSLQTRFAPNSSKPNFVTNGKNYTTSSADAQAAADAFTLTTAPVGVVLSAKIEGNKLIINAEAEAFSDASGVYVMGAYLIEDKVSGPQSGPIGASGYVEHHNVMRGSLSANAWGEVITENGLTAGQKYEKTYSVTIPEGYNSANFSYGVIIWKKIITIHNFVNAYSSN
ncbi:MAG TPA: hypothetical protein DEQ56_01620 [Bacteroidetes bacterium]|jgi:hypothetical protein|nr:hypothetical protein [Bacteroidota bacterium]